MSDTPKQIGTQWFSIPYLPDVLNSRELLEETKLGRLNEYLDNWTATLAALNSCRKVTFCVRFINWGNSESVSAFLGFRIDSDATPAVQSTV